MFSKQSVKRDFNRAAASYDEYAVIQRKVADRLFSYCDISKEDNVLDAGCGTGYFHEVLRKNKIYCPLVQADISFNMCKIAKEYSSPAEYGGAYVVNADIENMPFKEQAFNYIFSSLTLQWSNDLCDALKGFCSLLKNNGTVAVSITCEGALYQLRDVFSQMDGLSHINDFISHEKLCKDFSDAGFSQLEIFSEEITIFHKDIKSLLYSIKGVGASYKNAEAKYLGRDYFIRLGEVYKEKYGTDEGLPLSWKIIYAIAKK